MGLFDKSDNENVETNNKIKAQVYDFLKGYFKNAKKGNIDKCYVQDLKDVLVELDEVLKDTADDNDAITVIAANIAAKHQARHEEKRWEDVKKETFKKMEKFCKQKKKDLNKNNTPKLNNYDITKLREDYNNTAITFIGNKDRSDDPKIINDITEEAYKEKTRIFIDVKSKIIDTFSFDGTALLEIVNQKVKDPTLMGENSFEEICAATLGAYIEREKENIPSPAITQSYNSKSKAARKEKAPSDKPRDPLGPRND